MAWFDKLNKEAEKEDDIEFKPADLKKQLDKIDIQSAELTEIKSKLASLDAVTAYIEEQRAKNRREEAERLAAKALKDREAEAKNPIDWINDPENAAQRSLNPIIESQLRLNAKATRREIFEDPEFEYYHGEFKQKVDSLLDNESVSSQGNPTVIKNAYKIILADHMKDIRDNKLKSRFASASQASSGTGAPGANAEKVITLSNEEKRAAKSFGMSEEEYAKAKSEMTYV